LRYQAREEPVLQELGVFLGSRELCLGGGEVERENESNYY